MKIKYLIVLLAIFNLACRGQKTKSTKEFQYELNILTESKSGAIVKNERVGKSDTTIVVVSGQVLSKNQDVPFANISFINNKNESLGTQSDIEGNYRIVLTPGIYTVRFFCAGFNQIIIEKLALSTGDVHEIVVDLGISGGYQTYYIKSIKELTPEELKAEEAKRKKD